MSSDNPISFEDEQGNLVRFNANVNHHVILKIRLLYDGLTQAEFFRSYVEAYINNDDLILEFVERMKQKKGKRSKLKLSKTKRLHKMASQIKQEFGLSDSEFQDIFDIPLQDYSEL